MRQHSQVELQVSGFPNQMGPGEGLATPRNLREIPRAGVTQQAYVLTEVDGGPRTWWLLCWHGAYMDPQLLLLQLL